MDTTRWFDYSSNRRKRPVSRWEPAVFLFLLGAAVLLARMGSFAASPLFCPFRAWTGLLCPLCGITRGWIAVAHGDWGAAIRLHPFALAVAPLLVAAALGWRPSPATCRAGLAALALFGLVRIAIHTL